MDKAELDELRNYYDTNDFSESLEGAEWDRRTERSPMVGITVRLSAPLLESVRDIASRNDLKTTALIRSWIEESVDKERRHEVAVVVKQPARARASSASAIVKLGIDLSRSREEVDAVAEIDHFRQLGLTSVERSRRHHVGVYGPGVAGGRKVAV